MTHYARFTGRCCVRGVCSSAFRPSLGGKFFRLVGPPSGLGLCMGETEYPCRDLCLDPCLPYPSPHPSPDPCLEITELVVDQRVGRRRSGSRGCGNRDKDMEKTRIGIRIGTRIEELETSANTPSFRLAIAGPNQDVTLRRCWDEADDVVDLQVGACEADGEILIRPAGRGVVIV
jgi:hypothetical protein